MATRGNVVFASRFYIEDKELTSKNFSRIKSGNNRLIKNSYKIYVHSDMYPSGALKDLQAFLKLEGAKRRAGDTSYLSAWFVGWKCLDMLPYTRSMRDDNYKPEYCTNPSLDDMQKSGDFFGLGLLQETNDWVNYSYLIVPKLTESGNYYIDAKDNSFDIYVFEGNFNKAIAVINSEDDLDKYKEQDWWD